MAESTPRPEPQSPPPAPGPVAPDGEATPTSPPPPPAEAGAVAPTGAPDPTPDATSAASVLPAATAGPGGGPATRPRVAPWLLLYTIGRLAIAVALVLLLWLAGLGSYAGLLFGILLSMPVSYLALRPVRDRLTEALAARSVARRAAKEDLRARLSGGESDDA